jgi:hypothetical protein
MDKKEKIQVQGAEVALWMHSHSTIEFLGLWEYLNLSNSRGLKRGREAILNA